MRDTVTTSRPAPDATYRALQAVGEVLGREVCWAHGHGFHFEFDDGWTIAIRPDSVERLRVELCRFTRSVSALWTPAADLDRLREAVLCLADQLAGL